MREVTEATTRPHVSFSQLAVAARCGEEYRRKYIEGDPTDQNNIYALFGSAFHEGVETFETLNHEFTTNYDDYEERDQRYFWESAPEKLVPIVKKAMRTQMEEHGIKEQDLIYYGKQDLEFFFTDKIPQSAVSYSAFRHDEMHVGTRAWGVEPADWLEVQCEATIGDFPVLAVIDKVLVDSRGRLMIRDLKTGEPKPGHAAQLEIYRLAFKRAFGIEPYYGQILYVKRAKPHVEVVKWSLSDENVDQMVHRLRSAVGDPSSLIINGPLNGACQTCDFKVDCPWSSVRVRGVS